MWKRSIAYMSEVIGAFLRAECGLSAVSTHETDRVG